MFHVEHAQRGVFMIINVFGLPRMGKSTLLARCARRANKGKGLIFGHGLWKVRAGEFAPYSRVYSNFPLKGCYMIDFDQLGYYDFHDCLIIIDEISLYADSRDFKNFDKKIKQWFALHGHYRTDVLICSQNLEDSDKRIRNLAPVLLQVDKCGPFTLVRPIKRQADVIQGEIFIKSPPLSATWFLRKPYYSDFDSFAAPTLPPQPKQKIWM